MKIYKVTFTEHMLCNGKKTLTNSDALNISAMDAEAAITKTKKFVAKRGKRHKDEEGDVLSTVYGKTHEVEVLVDNYVS